MPGNDSVLRIIGVGLKNRDKMFRSVESWWQEEEMAGFCIWWSRKLEQQSQAVSFNCGSYRNKRHGPQEIFLLFLLGHLESEYPAAFHEVLEYWVQFPLPIYCLLGSGSWCVCNIPRKSSSGSRQTGCWAPTVSAWFPSLPQTNGNGTWVYFWGENLPHLWSMFFKGSGNKTQAWPISQHVLSHWPWRTGQGQPLLSLCWEKNSLSLELWGCWWPPSCPWS